MSAPLIPMLDAARLHAPLGRALKEAFERVLAEGVFIGGEAVAAFERALAAHVGASHVVGVSSGTDGLLAALTAFGIGPGDEVITTGYSFFATAGSIARLGATPVFVDIDPMTFNIDPRRIADAITERTAGIVPVHLFGQCADMDPILTTAETHGLFVVEDAAQSMGAAYKGRGAGTMGCMGVYSFFPAKNLGALGDSGAVVTGDDHLADTLRCLRQHGAAEPHRHERIGGNYRLDTLQAALLSAKLPMLQEWEAGRARVAAVYQERLAGLPGVTLPATAPGNRAIHNQFVLRVARRDTVQQALGRAGIASAVYYPTPLSLQPCFAALGYRAGALPECERAAREALAIPIDPLLTDDALDRITDTLRGACRNP